jgi:hypothetical protein
MIAIAANAKSFNSVKTLLTIVPHFVPIAFRADIIHMHNTATSLSAQSGVVSFGCSEKNRIRSTYSAKMIAMIAAEPGFKATIAVHENRKDHNGPNIWCKYAYAPPLSGIADPNSAYEAI